MNKKEMCDIIAERTGRSSREVELICNSAIDVVTESIYKGEEVRINRFGIFRRTLRQARTANNPQTGEPIEIPARFVPTLKFSKDVKDRVGMARE